MILPLLALLAISTPTPDANAKPKHEKKFCRTQATTGSRLPVTTCHTQPEWDAIDQAAQQSVQTPLPSGQVQH